MTSLHLVPKLGVNPTPNVLLNEPMACKGTTLSLNLSRNIICGKVLRSQGGGFRDRYVTESNFVEW